MEEKKVHLTWKVPAVRRTICLDSEVDTWVHQVATDTRKSVSKVISDLLHAQRTIRQELAAIAEAAREHETGHIAHVLLERHTHTISRSVDTQTREITALRGQIETLTAMLDRAFFAYLLHTPVVPEPNRAEAGTAATRRYEKWQAEVTDLLPKKRGQA